MSTYRKQFRLVAALLSAASWIVPSQLMAQKPPEEITFNLVANPKLAACLAGPYGAPSATVTVVRGERNDRMILRLRNIKPGVAFRSLHGTAELAPG